MTTQEDLAALFQRNLSLQQTVPVVPKEEPKEEPIIYSISQHYHHSAHVARPSSEPPQTDQLTTEIILSRHGVDVTTLFPSQLELFKTADAGQQMRLIELWRICPPDYGGHALAQDIGQWPDTMSDSSTQGPLTPIQGGDGRWNQMQAAEPYMQTGYEALAAREYENSAAQSKDIYAHFGTRSTDPVYKTVEDVHKYPNAMENQYAVYQGEDEEML
ncbi:hypothetical protein F5882DRAFT_427378 [Hyaloscypha sp. PMI_1271]|nr:hypothetical protein F5882DRAFT_427378 [Hyaloscypha sp. PMI_1271]